MPFVHSNKCHIYFHHKYRIWYMLYMNDAKQCSLWCIVEMTSFIYKWLVMLRGIVSISQSKLPSRLHSGRTPFWMLPTFVSNWLNCNSLCHFLDKNVTAKYILNLLLYIIANFCWQKFILEVFDQSSWSIGIWWMVSYFQPFFLVESNSAICQQLFHKGKKCTRGSFFTNAHSIQYNF